MFLQRPCHRAISFNVFLSTQSLTYNLLIREWFEGLPLTYGLLDYQNYTCLSLPSPLSIQDLLVSFMYMYFGGILVANFLSAITIEVTIAT